MDHISITCMQHFPFAPPSELFFLLVGSKLYPYTLLSVPVSKEKNRTLICCSGFGQVVIARTQFTNEEPILPGSTNRDIWVGHRFDIIPYAKHLEEFEGEEWRDISEEVKDEMHSLWQARLGDNWKERLLKLPPLKNQRPNIKPPTREDISRLSLWN